VDLPAFIRDARRGLLQQLAHDAAERPWPPPALPQEDGLLLPADGHDIHLAVRCPVTAHHLGQKGGTAVAITRSHSRHSSSKAVTPTEARNCSAMRSQSRTARPRSIIYRWASMKRKVKHR